MSGPVQLPVRGSMEIGQILNTTVRLLRGNLKVSVAIAAVPPAFMFGLFGIIAASVLIPMLGRLHQGPAPQDVIHIVLMWLPLLIPVILLYYLVFALNMAASAHAAIQADRGVSATFPESYAVAWSHAGRYIGLLLLIYAICFVPAMAIQLSVFAGFGLMALNNTQPNPVLIAAIPIAMLLQMALLVAGFIIALRFSLAFPASVAENLPAIEALKRSNALTRGARLKIFLTLLLIYAASYAVMMVVMMCGAVLIGVIGVFAFSGAHPDPSSPTFWVLVAMAALAFIVFIVLYVACSWAAYATALAVIYSDQRRSMDAAGMDPMATRAPA